MPLTTHPEIRARITAAQRRIAYAPDLRAAWAARADLERAYDELKDAEARAHQERLFQLAVGDRAVSP